MQFVALTTVDDRACLTRKGPPMLPTWLCKLMDVKNSSGRELPSSKARDDNAAALARTLSLQRANARAKSSRPEIVPAHQFDSHRFSKSIDALYVLSRVRDGVSPVEAILSSDECEELGSITSAINTDVHKVTLSSLSERMDKGADLWDREFSSMSSYASDQDGISTRERRGCSANAALSKSASSAAREKSSTMSPLSEDETGGFVLTFDTDSSSSCEEPGSGNSPVDCNCDCGSRRQQHDDNCCLQKANEWISWRKLTGNKSQETANTSCSGQCLPEGIVGESIAFVKVSYNPYEDFRDSMYQMIMEKDLEESMDMEELLDCYLNLNALELHDLITEVFSDVWSEIVMKVR